MVQGWRFEDAWIFASIGLADKWVDFRSIQRAADHYNHALPSDSEAASALNNLASAGLVEICGARVRLTELGRQLWGAAGAHGGFELVLHFQKALKSITYSCDSGEVSEEVWRHAVGARPQSWWRRAIGR